MADGKITVFKNNGKLLGYLCQVDLTCLGEDEYSITGIFQSADGSVPEKVDFNPQALPYKGIVEGIANTRHKQLINIYVQRGRQPITITALGTNG